MGPAEYFASPVVTLLMRARVAMCPLKIDNINFLVISVYRYESLDSSHDALSAPAATHPGTSVKGH